jgi:hypothetical protein
MLLSLDDDERGPMSHGSSLSEASNSWSLLPLLGLSVKGIGELD